VRRTFFLPIVVVILYAAAIPINMYFKGLPIARQHGADIIQNIFGATREFVADWAFMKAEEYHHRGLSFMKSIAYHEGESFTGEEVHHAHEGAPAAEGPQSLFEKIYSSVKINGDSHLKPAEEKESLPWFFIEVRFNPNDIRGYVLGAYWLERMGRLDESLKFLEEGEKNNPDSAAVKAALGHIYYKKGDLGKAVSYLEKARKLWQGALPVNAVSDRYSASDKYFALDLLGALYKRQGRYSEASETYVELYMYQPNESLKKKISNLRDANERPAEMEKNREDRK